VKCFVEQSDGKIIAGGYFTTLGGNPHSNIVRLNADGTEDTTFTCETDDGVTAVALQVY
jgi:hypothetical protein